MKNKEEINDIWNQIFIKAIAEVLGKKPENITFEDRSHFERYFGTGY